MKAASQKLLKLVKSTKGMALLAALVGYTFIVDTNLQQRRLMISEHYEMARNLIVQDIDCSVGDGEGDPAPDNAVKTLLASYPGSGQRFTWNIISALTKMKVADDWNFSGNLNEKPITVKTHFPHKAGTWSWGESMDQVLLLIRNPRWAIPAYHNLRFELDYATDWASSYAQMPSLYKERPAVAQWESWRDSHFDTEINGWTEYIEFWMDGGYDKEEGKIDGNCASSAINCRPKAIVDFDHFYQENPTSEYTKVSDVLEGSANVEVVAAQARVCVLGAVFEAKHLHEGGRPNPELVPQYRFTMIQHDKMLNRTIGLKNKYSSGVFVNDSASQELVRILDSYIVDMKGEHAIEAGIFLDQFTNAYFGVADCDSVTGALQNTCKFMKKRFNHKFFTDETYPFDFPYFQWLKDRAMLVSLNYNHIPRGSSVTIEDHCTWEGVTCEDYVVTELNLSSKDLVGTLPASLCETSITIYADAASCPAGCCA